ncbi:ABC transporter ATP-binding protein [Leucobacter rhizosphaerae]|uniref:ABC transporter ATP-binding protein n=1 Tax=Leucobacter rhizosphaerae TaxID=2932245 RepID=A0ABY4FZX8_9MICO|nr:ABC transporter ATP-binding protein [Leucobacter rhizosphaerae]UOQ61821.1 ABC transporter ATP-binding protein [Leucobacter rhizosphaerae]
MTQNIPTRASDGASHPALVFDRVTKSYGEVDAVADVDLEVEAGELICLLGSSGSGKTTLLRLVAGFEQPTRGRIRIDGSDVSRLSPADRGLGMVFQNYALFPHLTTQKNIEYGLKMRGWDRAARADRAREMLERMRLGGFGGRLPSELSGGQQQRVAIARALAYEPKILLMDEPMGALDKALKQDLLQEVRRVHREFGTTMLYVTHDREEALTLADRVAVMRNSQLIACDTVRDLYERPRSGYLAGFFSGANLFTGESRLGFALGAERTEGGTVACVRPGDLRIGIPDLDAMDSGTVVDALYLGESMQLSVAVPLRDGSAETVKVHLPTPAAAGIGIGDTVSIGVDRRDAMLLPSGDS